MSSKPIRPEGAAKSRSREPARVEQVLTLRQFAALNGVHLMTLRRLLDAGEGPRTIQISPGRVGIRESDGAAWQASRLRPATGAEA